MKIHIACNDGSPIDKVWSDIHGNGVGGAELALLSLAEQFAKDGHEVRIYNQTGGPREEAGIIFENINGINPKETDRVLITFRSPNERTEFAGAVRKIWWSTDKYTIGSFKKAAANNEFCITISPFHTNYLILYA